MEPNGSCHGWDQSQEQGGIARWEAVRFIERRSRFAIEVKFLSTNTRHTYTPYITAVTETATAKVMTSAM